MRFRLAGLQFWAIMTVLWLCATAVIAGSAYSQASITDQVRLQQQAKDIRAAGGDPLNYQWGPAIQIGNFTVPAVQQDAPYFWQTHGKQYTLLGLSLPLTTLVLLEIAAQILEGIKGLRGVKTTRTENTVTG